MSADDDARDPTLRALVRRHSNETPPVRLDAAIRAAARDAVQKPPVRRSAAWRVWIPLAAAASITAVLIGEAPRAPMVNDERAAAVTDMPEKRAADRAAAVSAAPEVAAGAGQRQRAQPDDVQPRLQSLAKSEQAPTATSAKPDIDERRPSSISRELNAKTDSLSRTDPTSKAASATTEAGALPAAPAASAMGERARTGAPARQEASTPSTPADRIARIRALRASGNDAEAARELARFRETHKDADLLLPDDLRAWAAALR